MKIFQTFILNYRKLRGRYIVYTVYCIYISTYKIYVLYSIQIDNTQTTVYSFYYKKENTDTFCSFILFKIERKK